MGREHRLMITDNDYLGGAFSIAGRMSGENT